MKLLIERKWLFILITLLLIITLTPFAVIYLMNNGNPYERYLLDKYIPPHLEKMGYTDQEILDAHYAEEKDSNNAEYYHGNYMVKFKEEPNVTYYYGLSKKGKHVVQFCERDDETTHTINGPSIHSESLCVNKE